LRGASNSFLRIVEVFPPSFSADDSREPVIGLRQKSRDFVERVRRIQSMADAILVADVKDTSRLKLSSVHSAAMLREQIGVDAIPVITARDSNRPAVASAIMTAFSLGLGQIMLAWGDRYTETEAGANVYDFGSLSEVIALAKKLAERAGVAGRILAPVDISSLSGPRGQELAASRLRSGADLLLAQPPTTDARSTLSRHESILRRLQLKSKVLPNVFPFRDPDDIRACRAKFGWNLPDRLMEVASHGEAGLLKEARGVAEKLRDLGFPGVYVSTRGRPELARFVLD
jgi:5,10-methylenetetrahydrofolate reductase